MKTMLLISISLLVLLACCKPEPTGEKNTVNKNIYEVSENLWYFDPNNNEEFVSDWKLLNEALVKRSLVIDRIIPTGQTLEYFILVKNSWEEE